MSVRSSHHTAIDAFLAQHRCEHVYLDVGTNIGVQIRKLYEPTKYPHAGVEPIFAQHFGPAPRCGVCTIGFEPNPVHRHRLQRLESSLRAAGAPVLILGAAAAAFDGTIQFDAKGDAEHEHWGGTTAAWGEELLRAPQARHAVPTLDLARVLLAVGKFRRSSPSLARARVFMKLDVEGSEYVVLPHLAYTGALCVADEITIEWHRAPGAGDVGAAVAAGLQRDFTWLLSERRPPCCTKLSGGDDESYMHDTDCALGRNATAPRSSPRAMEESMCLAVPLPARGALCPHRSPAGAPPPRASAAEDQPRCAPPTLPEELRSLWRRHATEKLGCGSHGLCKLRGKQMGGDEVARWLLGAGAAPVVALLVLLVRWCVLRGRRRGYPEL